MNGLHFDRELERLLKALRDREIRVNLMALFVTEAMTLADVGRTLDVDLPVLAYHTHVLESLGALDRDGDGRWSATELGILGYAAFIEPE